MFTGFEMTKAGIYKYGFKQGAEFFGPNGDHSSGRSTVSSIHDNAQIEFGDRRYWPRGAVKAYLDGFHAGGYLDGFYAGAYFDFFYPGASLDFIAGFER